MPAFRGDAYEFVTGPTLGSLFITEAEAMEASDLLQPALDMIGPGVGKDWAERNQDLQDFFDYSGLSENSPLFWEAFREWYGENG